MANESRRVRLNGDIVDIFLDVFNNYEIDSSGFIEHRCEDVHSLILFNGRLKKELFATQVQAVLEDDGAELLESKEVAIAGQPARLFKQRGEEEDFHLVLVIPYGIEGAGVLIRGVYPANDPALGEDIQRMLFSVSITLSDSPSGVPVHSPEDRIATYPAALEQAMTQPLETLELRVSNMVAFPPEILEMKNLETLFLVQNLFEKLPDAITTLKSLKVLNVSRTPLKALPPQIGQLKHLETLIAEACELTSIPDSIGDLPALKHLNLNYNSLATLPESIGRLTSLETLDLLANPFSSLPTSLGQLTSIRIKADQKAKALYCDISYPAPAPKRAITDKDLYARYDQDLLGRVDRAFDDPKWDNYLEAVRYCALRAIGFRSLEEDDLTQIGNSRLGGFPDLPPNLSYPTLGGKLYTFLAQINLQDITGLAAFFPQSGWLYFFIDDLESFNPVVLYHAGPQASLRPARPGADECYWDADHEGYSAHTVEFALFPSVPVLYHYDHYIFEHSKVKVLKEQLFDDPALEEDFNERIDELAAFSSMPFGNDIHCINSYVFTLSDSLQELAARAKGGLPEEWIVLLALGHDNNTQFCFWDAGTLCFLIHKADLANLDFTRVYCGLESS
jgi:uncharacterized protein YwqG